MIETFFEGLEVLNTALWGYVGTLFIFTIGLYFSFRSGWFQVRQFPKIVHHFFQCMGVRGDKTIPGVSPLRAFFASLGGCIGIGNLVTIAFAVQIGGPGALVWIWFIALMGMILKYAEIYLGIKFRIVNKYGGYDGGPMYFLAKAFPAIKWLPGVVSFLLCIYGIEIYMFSVIKSSVVENWHLPEIPTVIGLLFLVLFGVSGGVQRVGAISSFLVPIFVLVFLIMTVYVLVENAALLPSMLGTVFQSAFTGHAAVGGFAGSTFLLTAAKGISSACYSGDVGIGYASIIHAEAQTKEPSQQASLSIFGIFLDTFIVCTCTVLLLLSSGVWHEQIDASLLVQRALEGHFQHMEIFMPIFLFTLGYSTILPYMVAGMKCADFIWPQYGPKVYYLYAILAFLFFAFYDASYALTVMNISGGLLMLVNLPALYKLRHEISFKLVSKEHV